MNNTEELNFKISLSGTYHSKVPEYSIRLNDQIICSNTKVSKESDEIEIIEFSSPIVEGDHALYIRLENKDDSDTIKDSSNKDEYIIVKDMLLNIHNITIDDISLGSLIWNGEYHLDVPHIYNGQKISQLDNCVNLGWNGNYIFRFTSPFYVWLLENL